VVRAKRAGPFLDKKVLTAWNGQMIAGLARAGYVLRDRRALDLAEGAADFVLKNLRTKEGRLLRTYAAVPGEKAEGPAQWLPRRLCVSGAWVAGAA